MLFHYECQLPLTRFLVGYSLNHDEILFCFKKLILSISDIFEKKGEASEIQFVKENNDV